MKITKKLLVAAISGTLFAPALFAEENAAPETAAAAAPEAEKPAVVIEVSEIAKKMDVKISGLIQAQYVYSKASGTAADQNGFSIRRSILGVNVNYGDEWKAKLSYEFDSGTKGGNNTDGYVFDAWIARKFDIGTLTVGYKKTHFIVEEYSSASKFPCLERSINSNFVAADKYAKGLAGSHIGLFWEGKFEEIIDYGIEVTNAVDKDYNASSNDLAVTVYFGTDFFKEGDFELYLGLNCTFNFGNDGDVARTNMGTVSGVEPYAKLKFCGFNLLVDFYYIDGESSSAIDPFYGVNATATYLFDCGFEPAIRFTYLNTDSHLVNADIQNRVPTTNLHDNATTYYFGANYYFNKYVKLSAGYEIGHYFGYTASEDSGTFRAMLQFSF